MERILYYFFIFILAANALHSMSVGGLFFFKRSGEKRANAFFGLLLILAGFTLFHNIFIVTDFFERFPRFYFLPIYFTLSIPVLIFFHVKLNLYPAYRFTGTDIKHFILPLGQLIFFISIFLMPVEEKSVMGRQFFNPFFGAFEQALYLGTTFAYLYFAHRYIRRKRVELRGKKHYVRKEWKLLTYQKNLIKVFLILFSIHTVFVISDFAAYEIFNVNMQTLKIYAGLGALSFAALVFWLGLYGFQVLIWGRKLIAGKSKKG